MVKSAGFLKKLKKVKDLIGTGASWVNKNIVKPLRPYIDTGLDMIGAPWAKKIVDTGSYLIDEWDRRDGRSTSTKAAPYIQKGVDILMDTQRSDQDKRYGGVMKTYSSPFGNRLN